MLIFGGIIEDFTLYTAVFKHFIGTFHAHLNISFQADCKGAMGLTAAHAAIFEQKVLAPRGTINAAVQRIILNNFEQNIRTFPIVQINKDRIFCQNPGELW